MHRLTGKILRPFWRMTRGLTLGAQAMVFDDKGHILLVRHGYRPGWHFPGGGVEWNETIIEALCRELHEEVGVEPTQTPELQGIFTNFTSFPGDHIAVYVVRDWRQDRVPAPNMEIREQIFVARDDLPEGLVTGARNRLLEYFEGGSLSARWVE